MKTNISYSHLEHDFYTCDSHNIYNWLREKWVKLLYREEGGENTRITRVSFSSLRIRIQWVRACVPTSTLTI